MRRALSVAQAHRPDEYSSRALPAARFQRPVRKEGSFLQQILAFFTILNLILLQELFHLSALLRPEVLRLARLLDNCGCQEDQQVRFLHRSRIESKQPPEDRNITQQRNFPLGDGQVVFEQPAQCHTFLIVDDDRGDGFAFVQRRP